MAWHECPHLEYTSVAARLCRAQGDKWASWDQLGNQPCLGKRREGKEQPLAPGGEAGEEPVLPGVQAGVDDRPALQVEPEVEVVEPPPRLWQPSKGRQPRHLQGGAGQGVLRSS